MMVKFVGLVKVEKEAKYLQASCEVRYWEDALVNGEEDEDGSRIPCRRGDLWEPLIDLDAGVILNWTDGVEADIHYKVCDAGLYELLDEDSNLITKRDGYVPRIMCPGDNGYGDYVIMTVDGKGKIEDFRADIRGFGEED